MDIIDVTMEKEDLLIVIGALLKVKSSHAVVDKKLDDIIDKLSLQAASSTTIKDYGDIVNKKCVK